MAGAGGGGGGPGWLCSACAAPALVAPHADSPEPYRCEGSLGHRLASPAFDDTAAGRVGRGGVDEATADKLWSLGTEEAPQWVACTATRPACDTRSSGSTTATGCSGGLGGRTAGVGSCRTLDSGSSSEEEEGSSEGAAAFTCGLSGPRACERRPQHWGRRRPKGVEELRARLAKDRASRELAPEHDQAVDDSSRHAELSAEAALESGDWWQLQAAMQLVASVGLADVWGPRLHEAMREISRRQNSRPEPEATAVSSPEPNPEALSSPLLQAALGTYRSRVGAARELREAAIAHDADRLRKAIAAARGQGVRRLELERAEEALGELKAGSGQLLCRGPAEGSRPEEGPEALYLPPGSAPDPCAGAMLYTPGLDFQPLLSSPALLQPVMPRLQWALPPQPEPVPVGGAPSAPLWGWPRLGG